MTRPRHLRLIFDPGTTKPWVVQYSIDDTQTWVDVSRFHRPEEATNYVEEIAGRDRNLLEAEQ